ncbi:MAG: NAD-dependent epimerase/dehydratase family protein [Desulfobacteraceae bacterium]|nr:NAD-dependent epimerase/dehydratase family protein [Desulfobacteraceae bacterium]
MRILITGVAGFIGSNLAERLIKEGHSVKGIDNLAYGIKEQVPKEVEFHQLDIRSKEIYPLFNGVDFVFHLAAKNCISDCQSDPIETSDINVTGTVNVFEASKRTDVKKVIYAESSAMYEASRVFPTPESQVQPDSFYATSKVASMYFADAYEKFSNLKFTALRYFSVYGPRQDYQRSIPPVMSAFIIKLLKGESPVIYGTGKKKRDFVYVDDVNDFHLLCINDSRTDGKVFNIGSGQNYSISEISELISNLLGIRIPPVYEPDLPGEAERTLAAITKAEVLGWMPRTDIVEGLKSMIEYIKDEFQRGNIR